MAYTQLEEYAKSRIVNPLAFTVEDLLEATNDYTEKGVEFLSLEPQPTLKVLFYGPNHPLLHLLERALYLFLGYIIFVIETVYLLQNKAYI